MSVIITGESYKPELSTHYPSVQNEPRGRLVVTVLMTCQRFSDCTNVGVRTEKSFIIG